MTTTVIVKANHGWPVKVTAVDKSADGTEARTEMRVEKNTEVSFAIWSGRDILVREIQPDEADFDAAAPASEPTAA
jgi:hypothetical protein